MSIVWSLKKIVDPVRAAQEEIQRRTEREQPKRTLAGDGPDGSQATPERFRCRVCGHEAEEQGYCPECLADTMVPVDSDNEDGEA